tara:strand:+ start:220 stop:438 length:219 start_codon:yes stop_codon:yes gene_type:complete
MIYFTKTANHFGENDVERITIETESLSQEDLKNTFQKFLTAISVHYKTETIYFEAEEETPEKNKRTAEDFFI